MKLRNAALAAAIIFALLSLRPQATQAGGEKPSMEGESYAGVERHDTTRQYYREPYGADFGPAYGSEYGRTYIFGSYYRPYRTHYYSYALPNYYSHYYPRRRHTRRYTRARKYRAPYSSYSYRYR